MSAISQVANATTQSAALASAPPPTIPADGSPQDGSANQPAVIISLSSSAGTNPPLSGQVSRVLNAISNANALADIAAHHDYAADVTDFGVAIANRNRAEDQGDAAHAAAGAIAGAASLGIQVSDSVSPDTIANGAAPGTLSISAFSFSSEGNNYAVTPGANGSFTETENGGTLHNYQGRTTDAGALQAIATLNAEAKSVANADSSKLSVVA